MAGFNGNIDEVACKEKLEALIYEALSSSNPVVELKSTFIKKNKDLNLYAKYYCAKNNLIYAEIKGKCFIYIGNDEDITEEVFFEQQSLSYRLRYILTGLLVVFYVLFWFFVVLFRFYY